jgi:hypothetical protein
MINRQRRFVSPCGLNGAQATGSVREDAITGEKLDSSCVSNIQPVLDPKCVRWTKSDGQFRHEEQSGEGYSLPHTD